MILNGSKEIVLSGINIGDFGIIDGKRKESFFDLLKKIEQIKQKIRIRILFDHFYQYIIYFWSFT